MIKFGYFFIKIIIAMELELERDLELILLDLGYEEKNNTRYLKDKKFREKKQVVEYKPIDYNILNYITLCMNIYFYSIVRSN